VIVFIAEVIGQHAQLSEEESWHCARVLRKKAGDPVRLIDGRGNSYEAVLDVVSEKKCTAKITRGPMPEEPAPYWLHLAVAPTKQIDRTEWMIEKAIEIGLHEISFFYSEHSERDTIKIERMLKIVESAVKQSLHSSIPKVNNIVPFKELIKKTKADQKLIAHCAEQTKTGIRQIDFSLGTNLVLVGPEGDFSLAEIEMAAGHGFKGIDLGPYRLRSETAGLFICTAIALLTNPK
jgi:16S rRNA (uracil1498-N3)-methyltransferase